MADKIFVIQSNRILSTFFDSYVRRLSGNKVTMNYTFYQHC
jgi:hypothetical protein